MRLIFSLIFLSLSLLSETINEQIHALETATPQERVELMNHIKEQLISMNEENRIQTLETLRANIQTKHEENYSDNHEMIGEKNSKENINHQMSPHFEMHEEMMHERHQHSRQNNNQDRARR